MNNRDILEYPDDEEIIEYDNVSDNIISEEEKPVKKNTGKKSHKKGNRNRARRRAVKFVFRILLVFILVVAVTFDVILYSAYLNQVKQVELITAEKEGLVEIMNSGQYITKEEAEARISSNREDVKKELKDEVLKMFENGDGILTILENVYSEKIVVPDNSGYYFFDVDEKLAKNGLDLSKFTYPVLNEETNEYEGELNYEEEGVIVKHGIDVSKFQGDINWTKVKNDNIEFAFLRCGYRGYETGKLVEDETFEDNIKACNSVGMDVGVYFFTEAVSEKEAIEEADFVLDLLKEYEVTLQMPIVLDVEQSSNQAKSRTRNLTSEDRTKIVIAFCERIKQAGYEPMIYGNLKSHMRMTDIYQLEDYSKWFAYYRTPLRYPYDFDIWQYSSTGSVDGIKGDVDLNIAFYREQDN